MSSYKNCNMMHFVLFALILGSLYMPAHQKKPATTPAEVDYGVDEYSEDEEGPPGNLVVPETTTAVAPPYFEQKEVIVYVSKNATTAKLECPVKNYNASRHAILWYKDNTPISNGNSAVKDIYKVDEQLALTIAPFTSNMQGNYSCNVMPSKVRRLSIVKLGEPQIQKPTIATTSGSHIKWFSNLVCCISLSTLAICFYTNMLI